MKPFINLLTLIILAVLAVSIVMRGRQAAMVINAVSGFFRDSYTAILGEAPQQTTGTRRVTRRRAA